MDKGLAYPETNGGIPYARMSGGYAERSCSSRCCGGGDDGCPCQGGLCKINKDWSGRVEHTFATFLDSELPLNEPCPIFGPSGNDGACDHVIRCRATDVNWNEFRFGRQHAQNGSCLGVRLSPIFGCRDIDVWNCDMMDTHRTRICREIAGEVETGDDWYEIPDAPPPGKWWRDFGDNNIPEIHFGIVMHKGLPARVRRPLYRFDYWHDFIGGGLSQPLDPSCGQHSYRIYCSAWFSLVDDSHYIHWQSREHGSRRGDGCGVLELRDGDLEPQFDISLQWGLTGRCRTGGKLIQATVDVEFNGDYVGGPGHINWRGHSIFSYGALGSCGPPDIGDDGGIDGIGVDPDDTRRIPPPFQPGEQPSPETTRAIEDFLARDPMRGCKGCGG